MNIIMKTDLSRHDDKSVFLFLSIRLDGLI
jgi:hypothetical protein